MQARQQEEQDLEYGDGVVFNRVFQAVSVPGDGDKIRLPASAFNELAGQGALDKGPMFFEISSISQPGSVSSGNTADLENEVAYLFPEHQAFLKKLTLLKLQVYVDY